MAVWSPRIGPRLILAAACMGFLAPASSLSQSERGEVAQGIYVVSYQRVLNEIKATKILRQAEAEITAVLQSQIDAAKAQLAAEEAALARERANLTPGEFEAQATDFDRRVRQLRRIATDRAKRLQTSFESAREDLVAQVRAQVLVLRQETGARIILHSEQALIWDPQLDLTDRLIDLVDESILEVRVPEIEFNEPIFSPEPGQNASEENDITDQ